MWKLSCKISRLDTIKLKISQPCQMVGDRWLHDKRKRIMYLGWSMYSIDVWVRSKENVSRE